MHQTDLSQSLSHAITKESLQKAISQQILSLLGMFQFCGQFFSHIMIFFITRERMKIVGDLLSTCFEKFQPVPRTVFSPTKKLFLQNENLNNFVDVCSKLTICILFKLGTGFFSGCSLTHLVSVASCVPVLACFVIFTCLYFDLCWQTQTATLS